MGKARDQGAKNEIINIIIRHYYEIINIIIRRTATDCALECERLVENEPDSDHLDENSPVAKRVAERRQPGVNLKTIIYLP